MKTEGNLLEEKAFLRNLRIQILKQSWRLLDGEEDDEEILDTIKKIHDLNSKTKRRASQALLI